MADRTSARIFGDIFDLLAEDPDKYKEVAHKIYGLVCGYDFDDYQMCANDACLVLGIARIGINTDCPEDGEIILYPGYSGYENARDVSESVYASRKRVQGVSDE